MSSTMKLDSRNQLVHHFNSLPSSLKWCVWIFISVILFSVATSIPHHFSLYASTVTSFKHCGYFLFPASIIQSPGKNEDNETSSNLHGTCPLRFLRILLVQFTGFSQLSKLWGLFILKHGKYNVCNSIIAVFDENAILGWKIGYKWFI